jgi:hypothetical protein
MKEYMSTSEFIDKYKLIPKNLRIKFIDYMYTIIKKFNIIDKLDMTFILDTICMYEKDNINYDNYSELGWLLLETIENDNSYSYKYIANCLRYYISKNKIINQKDIFSFRKKMILKSIREEVAYRPGNVGYEKARDNFYKNISNIR